MELIALLMLCATSRMSLELFLLHVHVSAADCYVQSMLCVPIVSITTGSVIAVACVFNKRLPEKR